MFKLEKMMKSMNTTNVIIVSAAACVAVYILYYFIKNRHNASVKKETMLNIDHSMDDDISTKVYHFLMESNGSYANYIDYLKSIKNPNPNLSDMDNYYKLKALQSMNGLSKDTLLNLMHGKI